MNVNTQVKETLPLPNYDQLRYELFDGYFMVVLLATKYTIEVQNFEVRNVMIS